jgi:hypothetical protein
MERSIFVSLRPYATVAGVVLLVSMVAGAFGELYVPSALGSAHDVVAHEPLFRAGFAAYLVEAVCDVALTLLFYVLLRPVHANLALMAAFFRIVSTATFAAAELFYFAALLFSGRAPYLSTFSAAQLESLTRLSLQLYADGGTLFMVFYGTAAVIIGYLMYRSGYFPKFLGALLAIGGLGFIVKNFAFVLAPSYAFVWLPLPMMLAMLALGLWLIIRGVGVSPMHPTLRAAQS